MEFFNYNRKDESHNNIIDEIVALASDQLNNVSDSQRAERIFNVNELICKNAVENTRFAKDFEANGMNIFKNPKVGKNKEVREYFNEIIEDTVTAVLPMVANNDYANLFAEVRQIGWGDTAKFNIKSNELYKVNEIAEGVARGALQPIFDDEITVNTKITEVTTSVDWISIASGVFDWSDFSIRYAKSYEGYLFLNVVKQIGIAASSMANPYKVSGFSNQNWTNLAARVKAANAGTDVVAVGTLADLGQVIPNQVGLQYGLGSEIAKKGYLDSYIGVKLVPIDQVLVPGTVNTTADFAVPNGTIYMLPVLPYKPVKIVFEGNSTIVEENVANTTDKTYAINIKAYAGVQAVIGSKLGSIEL